MTYKETREAYIKAGLLKYSLSFIPKIGLHRVSVKNLQINRIFIKRLTNTNARFITDFSNYAITANGVRFSSISNLTSIDHLYNDFKAKGYYDPITDSRKMSVVLDFSPNRRLDLYNLSNFHNQYDRISQDIYDNYGIGILDNDAQFRSMEIACQFILKHPLSEYSRVFHLLKSTNTRDLKIDYIKPDDGCNNWQSCVFKKPCYEMYVYDKSKELFDKHKIMLSDNIIKLELRIPEAYLYQTKLRGNIIDLEDKTIQDYFYRCYKNMILNPFSKWHKNYINNLDSIVDFYRSSYQQWITELYKYCIEQERDYYPMLIDWQDIMECPCIKKLDKRTQKRIRKALELRFLDTSFNKDTHSKLKEFFDAVDSCYHGTAPMREIYSNVEI